MSHCPIRNHPRPLLIEDFEGIADDFLRFSLVVLPESMQEEIYTILQGSVMANCFLFQTHLDISSRKVGKFRDPFPSASTCRCQGIGT